MAIADAKRRKIGRELIDWIYLGIKVGARRSLSDYHKLKNTDLSAAIEHLKRAVNMPLRARSRINEARRVYELENGVNTFNAFISSCLSLAGSVTLAELNAALTTLESDANSLISQKNTGSMTLDDVATWIEINWRNDALDWSFPFPADYQDAW